MKLDDCKNRVNHFHNLHLKHIRKTLIPIPPYTEQQRITKITERVSKSLDEISGILS